MILGFNNSFPTVRKGSYTAPQAMSIQMILYDLGYMSYDDIDGKFGGWTETCVMNFQRDHKLLADGIVGENTWIELCKEWFIRD